MKKLTKLIEKIQKIKLRTKILLLLFLVVVLFTRLYNLEGTARFTQDESSDLARMKGYWLTKQITLIGPISNDGSKIFSSLSYYMILPFAAAFDFTPVAPVYGMAFWGIITAALLLLLTYKINKKFVLSAGILIALWYPLVLTSRWSWNPHFVIFWAVLGVLAYQYRKKLGSISYLITGFSFAAMFHHHYVAIFTTAPFLLLISIPFLKKKEFKPVLLLLLGYIVPHLAFILFDLKNPPGLFFGQYLLSGRTPHVETALTFELVSQHFFRNIQVYLATFVQQSILQSLFGFSLLALFFLEIKKYTYRTLTWVIPGTAIIIAGLVLTDFEIRYVFSSVLFIFVWLLIPKKEKINSFLSKFALLLLILGSVFGIKNQLTVTQTPPSMKIIMQASDIIISTIKSKNLKSTNIAALASEDSAPLAERYRDYIQTRDVVLQAPSQYDISEHLFVISTATDEELRKTPDYAMRAFQDKKLKEVFSIEESEWKVYWYGVDLDN